MKLQNMVKEHNPSYMCKYSDSSDETIVPEFLESPWESEKSTSPRQETEKDLESILMKHYIDNTEEYGQNKFFKKLQLSQKLKFCPEIKRIEADGKVIIQFHVPRNDITRAPRPTTHRTAARIPASSSLTPAVKKKRERQRKFNKPLLDCDGEETNLVVDFSTPSTRSRGNLKYGREIHEIMKGCGWIKVKRFPKTIPKSETLEREFTSKSWKGSHWKMLSATADEFAMLTYVPEYEKGKERKEWHFDHWKLDDQGQWQLNILYSVHLTRVKSATDPTGDHFWKQYDVVGVPTYYTRATVKHITRKIRRRLLGRTDACEFG